MNINFVRSALLSAFSSCLVFAVGLSNAAIPVTVNGTVCTGATVTFNSSGTTVDVANVTVGCVGGVVTSITATSVTPTGGSATTPVTIKGTGFTVGASANVTIGGAAATNVTVIDTTTILAVVSGSAVVGTAPISVSIGSLTAANPPNYTVIKFDNVYSPYLLNMYPLDKKAGDTITVAGVNFVPGLTMTVGGYPATISNLTASQLQMQIPSQLTAGGTLLPVVLTVPNPTTNGLTSNFYAYTVVATPTTSGCPAGQDCAIGSTTPIPTPSKAPGVIGTPGPNIGLPVSTFYSVDPATRCTGATPAVGRLYQHNIDFAAYQGNGAVDYVFLQAGDALTYKFVAPAADTRQLFSYNSSTVVDYRPGFVSVSTRPCDFDVAKVAANDQCYKSGPAAGGVSLQYATFANADTRFECKLTPGATYYMNIRIQDARPASQGGSPATDACNTGTYCGGILQIR